MNLDINYPYPILSPLSNDYKMGSLDYESSYDNDKQKLIVDCKLTNPTIQRYIDNGDMAFGIRVSCNNARFRESLTQFTPHFEMDLTKNQVNGTAILDVFVVAIKEIDDFDKSPLANIYSDFTINYHIGDYVAMAISSKLNFEFDNRSSKSFIKYVKSDSTKDMQVSVTEDGIEILLSPSNFEKYSLYKSNSIYLKIIFYAITVPALNNALYQIISRGSEDFDIDSCDWLQAMLKQSDITWEQLNEDITSVSTLMTEILKNPINSFFDSLDQLGESEEEL